MAKNERTSAKTASTAGTILSQIAVYKKLMGLDDALIFINSTPLCKLDALESVLASALTQTADKPKSRRVIARKAKR